MEESKWTKISGYENWKNLLYQIHGIDISKSTVGANNIRSKLKKYNKYVYYWINDNDDKTKVFRAKPGIGTESELIAIFYGLKLAQKNNDKGKVLKESSTMKIKLSELRKLIKEQLSHYNVLGGTVPYSPEEMLKIVVKPIFKNGKIVIIPQFDDDINSEMKNNSSVIISKSNVWKKLENIIRDSKGKILYKSDSGQGEAVLKKYQNFNFIVSSVKVKTGLVGMVYMPQKDYDKMLDLWKNQ